MQTMLVMIQFDATNLLNGWYGNMPKNREIELKLCPFCDGEPKVRKCSGGYFKSYQVVCLVCGAKSKPEGFDNRSPFASGGAMKYRRIPLLNLMRKAAINWNNRTETIGE